MRFILLHAADDLKLFDAFLRLLGISVQFPIPTEG